jgi:hypothetical protein
MIYLSRESGLLGSQISHEHVPYVVKGNTLAGYVLPSFNVTCVMGKDITSSIVLMQNVTSVTLVATDTPSSAHFTR